MSEQKKIDISFRISSIKTLKFLIENIEEATKVDKSTFEFNIEAAMFADPIKKILGYNVILDVFVDKTRQFKVGELITQIIYEIVNFEDVIVNDKEKKLLNIPDQFVITLLSIALSTTRGIFASKTEGSVLDGVYMPVVDPKAFSIVPKQPQEIKE